MLEEINHNTNDGIVTRSELLAIGCTEVTLYKGRKVYELTTGLVASECSKCALVKLTGEYSADRSKYGGVRADCKKCEGRRKRTEYLVNPDKKRVASREAFRRGYLANPKKYIEKRQNWARRDYAANPEKYRIRNILYYEANKADISEKNRIRYADNPEKHKIRGHIRRARESALPNDLSTGQLAEISATFNSTCALTGDSDNLHADHVLPIGIGHGGTIYGNMVPLNAELNHSKNASHLYEWFDANRERFNLEQSRFDALIEYLAEANDMSTQEYRKYTDFCFDNPRVIDEVTGELVFVNESKAIA